MSLLSRKLRLYYLKLKWKKRNKHNFTSPGVYFDINKVKVGNYTYGYINAITYPCEGSGLEIGNFCSIGGDVTFILGGEHRLDFLTTYPVMEKILRKKVDTLSKGKVIVDDDVWIGHGATVLSGVHIMRGAVVAAGAVVTKDVPPYAIVAGVPAKIIKYRFEKSIIDSLNTVDFSRINYQTFCNFEKCFNQKIDKNVLDDILERLPTNGDSYE
ncbi:MAG: CatB-related O-acetyltransferase [Pseudobutyrivibrio ruminis]|nr:CatB-related O-acetyltransferase [Pseudobutyrivibrio ruminis]